MDFTAVTNAVLFLLKFNKFILLLRQ